jgi:DNA-binding NarL/FixJ family response regulator
MAANNVVTRREQRDEQEAVVGAVRKSLRELAVASSPRRSRSTAASSRLVPAQSAARAADALSMLNAALDAIQAAACIVGPSGEILCANAGARDVIAQCRGMAPRSFKELTSRTRTDLGWDLTPLRIGATGSGLLAIRRPSIDERRVCESVSAAVQRWCLTPRQGRVLALVAQGWTNGAIGEQLGICVGTVEFHVSAIFDKAGLQNRASLIAKLLET